MEFNSKLTKEICEVYGPTGRESKVAEYIQNQIRDHVDEMWVDCLGNLIAHKRETESALFCPRTWISSVL